MSWEENKAGTDVAWETDKKEINGLPPCTYTPISYVNKFKNYALHLALLTPKGYFDLLTNILFY